MKTHRQVLLNSATATHCSRWDSCESSSRCNNRGVLSIELIVVLPILMLILFALFEFTLLFFARGSVVEASRAGARTASLQGVTSEQIEADILNVLSPRLASGVQMGLVDGETGEPVTVAVKVPMSLAAPDFLWVIGYTLDGRYLYAETSMIKE